MIALSDVSENKPAIIAKPKKKAKKKAFKKAKKSPLKARPKLIENRFIFRDQLTANKYDLVAEIIKNIEMLENPKDRLVYQMKMLGYAYHELDAVQVLQPLDPSREGSKSNDGKEVIDAEFTVSEKDDFNALLRRI